MFKVGFVGLGIMGKPMAKNVLKAGYEVTVYDFNEATLEEMKQSNAKVAASNKEVAEKSDVIITMLPNSPNVESALFDENGLAEGLSAAKFNAFFESDRYNIFLFFHLPYIVYLLKWYSLGNDTFPFLTFSVVVPIKNIILLLPTHLC